MQRKIVPQQEQSKNVKELKDLIHSVKESKHIPVSLNSNTEIIEAFLQGKHCPPGTTLDFSCYYPFNKNSYKLAAKVLDNGGYPEEMTINLRYTEVGQDASRILANTLKSGKHLSGLSLNLSSNRLGDDEAKDWASVMTNPHCPQKFKLYLRENKITDNGIIVLANSLKSGRCLSLDVSKNTITEAGITSLIEALPYCPQNFTLNLSAMNLNNSHMKLIANGLVACPEGLTLILDNNVFDHEGIAFLFSPLKAGLCNKKLSINLSFNNNIGVLGAKVITDLLSSSKCPAGLTINFLMSQKTGQIKDEGAIEIAKALESGQCPPGVQLFLGGHNIGVRGVEAFKNALISGKCPRNLLVSLRLEKFGLGDANYDLCIKTMIDALKSGKCPSGLNLCLGEYFNDDLAVLIADALKSGCCPPRLKVSAWRGNIKDRGALALLDAIESGKCPIGLEFLNFEYQCEDKTLPEKIQNALEAHNFLLKNAVNKLGVSCFFFEKGTKQENSYVAKLPKDIRIEIYKMICPTEIESKPFINNVGVERYTYGKLSY